MAGRLEPFLREQALDYLRRRFDGEVDLGSFNVSMPIRDPIRLLLEKGKGARVRVPINSIRIRHQGRHDIPRLLLLDHLEFRLELSTLWAKPMLVDYVKPAKPKLTNPTQGREAGFGIM